MHTLGFVTVEIVHHNNISWMKGWSQQPFTEAREACTVNRTIQNHRRACSVQSNRMNQCAGFPASCRNSFDQPVAAKGPSPESREICFQACFVNKNKLLCIDT